MQVPSRTVQGLGVFNEQGQERTKVYWGKGKKEEWNCVILEKEEEAARYEM